MKRIALALISVVALIAFVLVSVDMVNTGDASNVMEAVVLFIVALSCAVWCRIIEDKERGWR